MAVESERNVFEESIPYGLCDGTYKNIAGSIPSVKFVDDVKEFLDKNNVKPDQVLQVLQTLLQRLKVYEKHVVNKKASIMAKVPETKESLSVLKLLMKRKEKDEATELDFVLSDQVHSSCRVDASNDKVGLWLGANVMLEYTYEEAMAMLSENYTKGQQRLTQLNEELAFVKTQITTTEVTLARVYNYDVQVRREKET